MMGSEAPRGRLHSRELERLQDMVKKLGVEDDENSEEGEYHIDHERLNNGATIGSTNGSLRNDLETSFSSVNSESENGTMLDKSLNEFNELALDESLDHVQEDSWLCESPLVSVTLPKSPYIWLKEDINTPELKRARPSLITKLDYIGIQNRDEQLEKIISQHGYADERPGRLYHSASFASMMSLDWDYENEGVRNNGRSGSSRNAWSDPRRKVSSDFDPSYGGHPSLRHGSSDRGYPDYDDGYNGRQPRKVSYDMEDPYSYHGRKYSFELDDPYDGQEDLEPLDLDFESPPVMRRSVVAPNPKVTKRSARQASPLRSRSPEKYSDLAEEDLVAKPRGKVRPRKARAFERSNSRDSDSNPALAAAVYSDQSDLDSVGEQASPRASRSSSRGSLLSDDMGPVRPRGAKESPSQAVSTTGQVKKRGAKIAKPAHQPQIRPRGSATADKGDVSLKVKLPQSSSGGPVIRRRGAGPTVPNGSSPRPSSPLGADSSSQESLTMVPTPRTSTSTPKTRQSLPQPRRSGIGTGIPTSRGSIPRVRRSASPEVTPRRSASPDSRPRPRRSPGVGAQTTSPLVAQSWQAGMH